MAVSVTMMMMVVGFMWVLKMTFTSCETPSN